MKRTYLDSSVLIQAVQGVDGDKTAVLLARLVEPRGFEPLTS